MTPRHTTETGSANLRRPVDLGEELTSELEELMQEFLSRATRRNDPIQTEISSELRAQLDALGYLE